MKERKTHYAPNRFKSYLQCGAVYKRNTQSTNHLDAVTCRVCMFSYLAEQAPWAREFMDKLRGADVAAKRSGRSLGPVAVPATLSEKVDGKEERLGRSLASLLADECCSQELIRELLTQSAPTGGAVQPVMDNSGAAAEPVGVQPGKIAEQAGDAGKVSQEVFRDF